MQLRTVAVVAAVTVARLSTGTVKLLVLVTTG